MGALKTITRRAFLIGSAAIAGGVAFGTYSYRKPIANPLLEEVVDGEAAITPFIKIGKDGIVLITPRADKGQGAYSVQAHLLAEELDVDPHKVTLSPGMPGPAYYNGAVFEEGSPLPSTDDSWIAERMRGFLSVPPKLMGMQMTGGSSTVPDMFKRLRAAGATARETLKEAAAQRTGIARDQLKTADAHVILPDETRIAYTDLAAEAAAIEPITRVALRPPSEWKLLGKDTATRVDMKRKCTGTEHYGIDLSIEGMVYASVRANPNLGGSVSSFDASVAEGMKGVRKVVELKHGVAVIADNTWRAINAVNAIDITFGDGPMPSEQDEVWKTLADAFDGSHDSRNKNIGDVEVALGQDDVEVIEAEYKVPYLAHAPMEPMNAIVLYKDDGIDIWTGTQIPRFIQDHVSGATGIAKEKIAVYVQPMGGSFGRRLEDTYVLQAVEIAAAVKGTPVKMTWSREEDMTHDYPRPAQVARSRGATRGKDIVAFDIGVASQSVMGSWMGRLMGPVPGPDATIVSGAWDQPFDIANYRVTGYKAPEMVPVSSWRSVGNSGVGFMHNGFLDELFAAANVDPMDELIARCTHELSLEVLKEVKAMSGWDGRRIDENRGRGVSFTVSFGVPTAEVVEVTNTERGIKIDKVYIACEVGTVLEPKNIHAQLMGGAIWGLGHAMNCETTYANSTPQQTNYHAFEGMRMHQSPEITIKALENGDTVRGIGEPAVPPAAAALANAIFAVTGKRIRELPLNKHIDFV